MNERQDREPGVQIVRKRLADGTVKEYRYQRKRSGSTATRVRYIPGTIGALLFAYQSSPEWEALRPQTRKSYLDKFRWLNESNNVPVADIRRRHIVAIRDIVHMKSGPGAAYVFLRVVSTLFSWAISREWIEFNPAARIRSARLGSISAWTESEAEKAIASVCEPIRRAVILGMYTGQRRGDLCALRWSAYDGHTIRIVQEKTAQILVIPVHPRLRMEMDIWKRTARSVFVLTTTRGLPFAPGLLSATMRQALDKAGLPRHLSVHGLRKLAATMLAEAGCSTHEVAAVTGHKTLSMVQHYTAAADQERLAKAAISRMKTDFVNRL